MKAKIKEFMRWSLNKLAGLIPQDILRKYALRLASIVPQDSKTIYEVSRAYVNQFRGENNVDFFSNGEYRFLKDNINYFNLLFDIGANIGDWTEMVLSLRKDIQIYCFEPAPDTFIKLAERCFPDNVVINNFGLGSIVQSRDLYVFEEDSGLNSLYKREGLEYVGVKTPVKTERVNIQTFDYYCLHYKIDKVDYVKIDVEGNELEVLEGMRAMLGGGKVGVVQFEYGGGTYIDARILLKDVFGFFRGLDYVLFKIYPKELRLYEKYSQDVENFQYQNWLAIRRDLVPFLH
jgi:FkbM family methyltransferase